MAKYAEILIGFQEVPDEISLCINITGCQNNCLECHSLWLKDDFGKELTEDELQTLINSNNGITCVCFMGQGRDVNQIIDLAKFIKKNYNLKTALYSGDEKMPDNIEGLDYIKIGPYIPELGALSSKTTNQRMYKIVDGELIDITNKFLKCY